MTIRPDFGSLVDLEEKAVSESDEAWTITGYASVFNNVDQGNDVMMPGAFSKSLRERGLPLLLFNHKMEDAPIGTIVDCKEDKRGLWFKGELPKDDSFVAGRIVPQLKRRGLKGTSIGYRATQKETRKSDGARLLKQVSLYEISVVNLPMNAEAAVETVKGLVPFQDLPISRDAKSWDATAALKRVTEHFGDSDELRRAFLFYDEEKGADSRFLIADVSEDGDLAANHIAVYKAVATLCGAGKGDTLPEEAEAAVKEHIDRIYQRLSLDSPFKSLSVDEFKVLDAGEREARLRALGVSRTLAKALVSGQRDADRSTTPRDAGSQAVDAKSLHTAISHMGDVAAAITRLAQDLKPR